MFFDFFKTLSLKNDTPTLSAAEGVFGEQNTITGHQKARETASEWLIGQEHP